ncbi:hypothetical protein HW132_17835 [Brasilonema sp. CT11]|nr:hypothetical protein [Brasilonema sp. CT11]
MTKEGVYGLAGVTGVGFDWRIFQRGALSVVVVWYTSTPKQTGTPPPRSSLMSLLNKMVVDPVPPPITPPTPPPFQGSQKSKIKNQN